MRFGLAFLFAIFLTAPASAVFEGCSGTAKYKIVFYNFLKPALFGDMIPEDGLVYSPLSAASHSGRVSVFTVRGFASQQVRDVAEKGDNSGVVAQVKALQKAGYVKDLTAAAGPTLPGNSTELELMVDCDNSFVTVLGMIAPSPDWIVQISNVNLYSKELDMFIPSRWGRLIAYDAGTDSGGDFTNPADTTLDVPTMPPMNIAPLVEDETDAFNGKAVGKYVIKRVA